MVDRPYKNKAITTKEGRWEGKDAITKCKAGARRGRQGPISQHPGLAGQDKVNPQSDRDPSFQAGTLEKVSLSKQMP